MKASTELMGGLKSVQMLEGYAGQIKDNR